MRIRGTADCSLKKDLDIVANRSNNIVIAKIYQEFLIGLSTLLSSGQPDRPLYFFVLIDKETESYRD